MTRGIELIVMGLGGLSLFVVAFLGFASMSGSPLSEVAVIGSLFADEEEGEDEPNAGTTPEDLPLASEKQVVEAQVGLLGSYSLESPYSADELQALALDLKSAKLAFEERSQVLDKRETSIGEREELLVDQFQTLEELRDELERFETELSLRSAEVDRDETVEDASDEARWARRAKLFESGDAEESIEHLMQFDANDAARILVNLADERAVALLNAIPATDWKSYVDAYSALTE